MRAALRHALAPIGIAGLVGAAVVATPRAAAGQGAVPARRDFADVHLQAFLRERAFPLESIPAGAYERAMRQVQGMRGSPAAGALSRSALMGGAGWRAIGPTPIAPQSTFYNGRGPNAGRVNAIAVDPRDGTVVYVGTARGGVWKTTNGGVTWRPLTDAQCSLGINAVTIDPADTRIVYAATGDHARSLSAPCGILRSTDGGATWTTLGGTAFGLRADVYDVLVDRATAGSATATTLVAGTSRGTYRSTDSGASWTYVGPALEQIVASPADPKLLLGGQPLYAAGSGLYRSTDGGLTWTPQAGVFGSLAAGRTRVAFSPSSPNVAYAAACQSSDVTPFGAVSRSTDGGVTWTVTNSTLGTSDFTGQCWYDMHVTVDALDANRVYLGGVWLYRSTDGGKTFAHIGDHQIHSDQQSFTVDPSSPSVLYAGSDGGVFRSLDAGTTWSSLAATIGTALFTRGIAINSANPTLVLGGTQDNGSLETNGTSVWTEVSSGDGGYGGYSAGSGQTAWTEYVWGVPGSSGPERRDGATSYFTLKANGINSSDAGSFYPPLVLDPVRPQTLYFGTYRVYRTRDNGESWSPISAWASGTTGTVTAIAAAAADSLVVYAGTNVGSLQSTIDGGASWRVGSGVPQRNVTAIAVDSANPSIAYATLSGFGSAHVIRTMDAGLSWTNIGASLPDAPANDIVAQPGGEIDVATDVGLFTSTNGGGSWALAQGLPNVVMMSLAYHSASRTLVVGTYGRGMFAYSYGGTAVLRGDVDGDGQVAAADAQAVLSAVVGRLVPANYHLFPQGDANCDDVTSVLDAQIILAKVVGLDVGTACVGSTR